MLTRPGRPRLLPSLTWVAGSIGVAGLLTAGHLAVVARALPAVEYGGFGAFWALALVVALGAFLPVELELARVVRPGPGAHRLPPGTAAAVALLTALSVAVLLAAGPLLAPALGGGSGLWAALVAVCVASGPQFLLRGLLLGAGAYGWYGALLLLDTGARLGLAAALATTASPTAAQFAWTVPLAVALAHGPLLLWWLRRGRRPAAAEVPPGPPVLPGAIGHLLVGTLCAQALLNAAPVLVPAAAGAGAGEQLLAAQFVAGFTLVRLPLFVAVPLQGALVPPLAALDAGGDPRSGRRLLTGLVLGTGLLAGAGALVGLLAGPWLVSTLFGDRYALPGPDLALLAAGAGCHVGLLVAGQALVAAGRHRDTALAWAAGLGTAAVVVAVVPGLVARASLGFTVGSAAGLLAAVLLLARRRPTRARPAAPGPLSPGARP
ncbi:lipopolysaccharide biosynthesis protein [Blastococcus sp. SYSU D00695]